MKLFKLYFPSQTRDGVSIPHSVLRDTCSVIVSDFGGCTCYPASGYFKHPSGRVQLEHVTVIEVADVGPAIVARHARLIARKCDQESVMWAEPDGTVHFEKG